MTRTTDPARAKLIQLIHIGKEKLGLDRDAYEALLDGVTGKASSTELSVRELVKVLEMMRGMGFLPRSRSGGGRKKLRIRPGEAPLCSEEQLYYIKGLWELASRSKTEAALNSFIKRLVHVDNVRFLDTKAAIRVTLALRDMAVKAGFDPDGPRGRSGQ